MGRPADWQPLADSDPIPGNPERLEELGKKLRKTADELEKQLRHIKAAAEVESWDSNAGKEFREKAKKCRGRLEAAHKRYDTAADAIGDRIADHGADYESNASATPGTYVTELKRAQKIAEIARQDAQQAESDQSAAKKGLDALDKSGKDKKSDKGDDKSKTKLEDQERAAGAALGSARDKLEKAKSIRDAAAKKARDAIDDVISGDALKDGFWDNFADVVDKISSVTELVSKWAGIAALAVGWIPIIGQGLAGLLGAISMVATLVNIACTVIQVGMGDASWTELAWSAVGLLMMGAGKVMAKLGGKYVARTLTRMKKAKSGNQTGKQVKRNRQKFNRDSGKRPKLEKGDIPKAIREPVTEIFKKSTWKDGFQGGYRQAYRELKNRGDGSFVKGSFKSMSLADASVASDLKEIKHLGKSMSEHFAVNQASRMATGLSVAGSGVTAAGLFIDEVH
ncbi:hypothetical protein HUT18_25600 [Streptomyces sp. NA04227]|uniref:hypothetical protein n=1 Tax=Streptomyces sp. NA04227 TaxID=2742136 RepID=UPI00159031E1|nr:hypothetical protein [Streptomyces sp. NA04227]QKW09254.1 hypothetical protein HUT18_25600 [Streptomyces sp. NA04227]